MTTPKSNKLWQDYRSQLDKLNPNGASFQSDLKEVEVKRKKYMHQRNIEMGRSA